MRNAIAGRDCVASGTANAIVLTTRTPFNAGAPTALQDGATYSARITTANTGATTVNVNGLGVKSVKKNNYANELEADDITAGLYDFVYNSGEDAFELVAKKAVFEGGAGGGSWSTVIEVGDGDLSGGQYTVTAANIKADVTLFIYTGTTDAEFLIEGINANTLDTFDFFIDNDAQTDTLLLTVTPDGTDKIDQNSNRIIAVKEGAIHFKAIDGAAYNNVTTQLITI